VGVGFNWADAVPGTRSEYSLEAFYRFPLFPLVDVTVPYQSIWDPALDIGIDHAHTPNPGRLRAAGGRAREAAPTAVSPM